jgi:hypothetical protein
MFTNIRSQTYKNDFQHNLSVDIGTSYLNFNINSSTPIAFRFGMSVFDLYFDVASNYERVYNYKSNYKTDKDDKILVGVFNFGYNFYLNRKLYLTPLFGYAYSKDISDNYYTHALYRHNMNHSKLNLGLNVCYKHNDIGLLVGTGSTEIIKIGIIVYAEKNGKHKLYKY